MEELSFGPWLSRYRKILGMTQKELAEHIHCATITLRKIESEERRPSVQLCSRLIQILDIPVDEQGAFFRFARGYGEPLSLNPVKGSPWLLSGETHNSNISSPALARFGYIRDPLDWNRFLLDPKIQHLTPAIMQSYTTGNFELTHRAASNDPEGARVIILVPIEVPSHVARMILANINPGEATSKSSFESFKH